jgi:hypothetical protein
VTARGICDVGEDVHGGKLVFALMEGNGSAYVGLESAHVHGNLKSVSGQCLENVRGEYLTNAKCFGNASGRYSKDADVENVVDPHPYEIYSVNVQGARALVHGWGVASEYATHVGARD